MIAKKLVLTKWKSVNVPTYKRWLEDITSTLHLERIRQTPTLQSNLATPSIIPCKCKPNSAVHLSACTAQLLTWQIDKGLRRVGGVEGWDKSDGWCRGRRGRVAF